MTEVGRPWTVVPYGVTTVLTDALLTLFAAWVLVRVMQRDDIVWGVAAILLAATIATSVVVHWPLSWAAAKLIARGHVIVAVLFDLVSRGWWLFVLLVVAHWLAPRSVGRALVAALLGYAVSAAAWWWLPAMPVLTTAKVAAPPVAVVDAPKGSSEDDEDDADSAKEPDFDAEAVIYNQRDLLDAATAKLRPQTPGVVDLYVVAFAGDAEENVFRNEAEYAEKLFAQRFGAEGRVLVLENNAATVATRPLATLTNLTWALDDVAKTMDPAEDVLLLYVTTHGSHDHELLVDLDAAAARPDRARGSRRCAGDETRHPLEGRRRQRVLFRRLHRSAARRFDAGDHVRARRPHVVRLRRGFGHHVFRQGVPRRSAEPDDVDTGRVPPGTEIGRGMGGQGQGRALRTADRVDAQHRSQARDVAAPAETGRAGAVRAGGIHAVMRAPIAVLASPALAGELRTRHVRHPA